MTLPNDIFFANDKDDPQNAKDMTKKEIEQERIDRLITKLNDDDLMDDIISDLSRRISKTVLWAIETDGVEINDGTCQVAGESIITEIIESLEESE